MPSIADTRSMMEVKRQNRFSLLFPSDVGGAILNASVVSSSRPKWQVNDQDLHLLNTRWYLAGKPNWETWTCEFYDFIDDNVLRNMFIWYKLVYDPQTTLMQVPSRYKKDVKITMLGAQLEPIESYQLKGAWPTTMDPGTLDMTAEGTVMKLSVTFRYDYALMEGA